MSLTRRMFTQALASTLFLHHLPSFAQSVKFWASLTLPEAKKLRVLSVPVRLPICFCWLSRQKNWSVFLLLTLLARRQFH